MVIIRLSRGGAKHRPFYRVVVIDSRKARNGACIETLGYFNPLSSEKEIKFNVYLERINYWISVGAKLSERVKYLLSNKIQ
ncbi:MAG TPA: 30S ribosomal protein S16 [Candidatus Azosocius sp. HAIN]